MTKKVRLAVVGGGFGSGHHWHEHPDCEVTAVTDLLPERRQRLAEVYQCRRIFNSLEEMLDKASGTFDAVAICTDAPSHSRHVLACMEAGKHVTSAVPVAQTLEDCIRIKDAVERTGLKYMLMETSYYRQPCIAARELYRAGEFGRIGYSEVEYYHGGIGTAANMARRWKGKDNWRFGLPPMLYPTHALGLMVGVTRERIIKVACLGQRVGEDFAKAEENRYRNAFNNEMAVGITEHGNICRFNVLWNIAAHGERGQWLGEKRSCYMALAIQRPLERGLAPSVDRQPWAHTTMRSGDKAQPWIVPEYWRDRLPERMRHESGHGGSHVFLSYEFIQSIVEDRDPAIDIYESLSMTVPGIIAHQSALAGGRQMDVPVFRKKERRS
jgi:predicted dehydrogenase